MNTTHTRALLLALATSTLTSGCFDLDSFVLNGKPCAAGYDDEICDDKNMCSACDDDFDFAKFGLPAGSAHHPIPLSDGETNDAVFVPGGNGPLANSDGTGAFTIVFSHGNFGGIEHYLNRVALLAKTGANVIAVDYRSFGKSTDTKEPAEALFMSDADAALAFVPEILAAEGLDPEQPLALYGYSAGALSAVEMAVQAPPCTLMLEAPWPSVEAFTADSTFTGVPGSFVTSGGWDNISKLTTYRGPLLQLHGTLDFTVQIELGRQVFAAADSADKTMLEVEGAAHGNWLREGEEADVPHTIGESAYVDLLVEHLTGRCR
jgi:pimeloyl-ACP methyl ester carboxylesterase